MGPQEKYFIVKANLNWITPPKAKLPSLKDRLSVSKIVHVHDLEDGESWIEGAIRVFDKYVEYKEQQKSEDLNTELTLMSAIKSVESIGDEIISL